VRRLFLLLVTGLCISLQGQNVKIYIKAAEQYTANGFYEDALIQLGKAIEIDPQNGDVFFEKGKINELLGNLNEAAQNYKVLPYLVPVQQKIF
jgi:tetratricopeptide (TPR) repeat protein